MCTRGLRARNIIHIIEKPVRATEGTTIISSRHTAIVSAAQEYDINFYWFTKHDLLSD